MTIKPREFTKDFFLSNVYQEKSVMSVRITLCVAGCPQDFMLELHNECVSRPGVDTSLSWDLIICTPENVIPVPGYYSPRLYNSKYLSCVHCQHLLRVNRVKFT